MKNKAKIALSILLTIFLALPASSAGAGVFSPNANYEYLVGSAIWQLSAESQALMQQAFAAAKGRISEMARNCLDPEAKDWTYETDAQGVTRMMYRGLRVAIISDIDDTLVDGAHYTADIVGANGDMNNAAFARFVLSEGCTALPGALDFILYCVENGVEVFYVTNRFDQGYKIGQSDSVGSYEQSIREQGAGLYVSTEGDEIGSTIHQVLGMSFYDITLASMTRLGFPIDDKHLIMNDSRLYGESKARARSAITAGCEGYPNGQRADGNVSGGALTITCPPHHVALMLGDQLGDFTDAFAASGLDAVSRAALTEQYADKWGAEWIVLPNAVYGSAFAYALSYGVPALFAEYAYTDARAIGE